MDKLKDLPSVLMRKILFTLSLGCGCLGVGIVCFFAIGDHILLILSGFVFIFTLAKSVAIYRIAASQSFEIVEGICIGLSNKPFAKCRKIRIMNLDGIESSLMISKQLKFKIGCSYRFYFKAGSQPIFGSEYLDTSLSTDLFLGYEETDALTEQALHV